MSQQHAARHIALITATCCLFSALCDSSCCGAYSVLHHSSCSGVWCTIAQQLQWSVVYYCTAVAAGVVHYATAVAVGCSPPPHSSYSEVQCTIPQQLQ